MIRKTIWLLFTLTLLPKTIQTSNAQSNGEKKTTFLTDDELERIERERTRNVVRLAATDMLNSEIVTNRTRAYLSCESGEMIVKINFNAPFRGVAYANYDRSSHCKFYGDGSTYYEMIIPLKGCGTKQEAPRLFLNNIIFRFHRTLELEEDEIKTIICRYPPPLAPPPVDPVPPILEPTSPTPIILPTKLSEIELLLIICGLLFLTLLLLGIGIAYYCLKRRNIKIVRKKKLSTGPPSEITKLSQSTVFDQIRIPRATAQSTESSETIPSDYPSESLSEDERRTIVSETSTMRQDQYKYANAAFIPEPYPMDVEKADSVSNIPIPAMHKPNITTQNLMTTILETQNFTDENVFNTTHKRTISQLYKKFPTKYSPPSIPDNDIPEAGSEIIEEIPRRRHSIPSPAPSLKGSIPDDDVWSHSEVDETPAVIPYVKRKRLEMATEDDTLIDKEQFTDITEDTTHNKVIVYPPPKIVLKQIDDFYVTNISEKTTTDVVSKKSANKPLPGTSQIYSPRPTKEILDAYTEDVERFKSDTSEFVDVSTRSKTRETKTRTRESIITSLMDSPPPVDGVQQLTPEIKRKWRTVITTDEIFRSLVIESTTTEEFIRISRDIRYENLFEPKTWETIIRMLSHPDVMRSVETQTDDLRPTPVTRRRKVSYPGALLPRSQRTDSIVSQSSIFDYDMRSITEEDVTFSRPERTTATAYSIDMRRVDAVEQSPSSYLQTVPFSPRVAHQVHRSTNLSEFVVPSDRSLFSTRDLPIDTLNLAIPDTHSFSVQRQYNSRQADTRSRYAIFQRAATHEYYRGSPSRTLSRHGTSVEGAEEIKSVTETDVYDQWRRQ